MAVWRRKERSADVLAGAGDGGRIPKGYIPMALVGDEGDSEERVLVHVRMLKEPCVMLLLEMAEQQFGYGQQGVLRIPCDGRQFERILNATCRVG